MAQNRAPKQWQLTKHETINSFENWRQNLVYILSLDDNFAPYLAEDFTWEKKTAVNPTRGLEDDGEDVPQRRRKTAVQKNVQLDLMLGQIANYSCVISRNSIIKNSTSVSDIWQKIRQHYGFQSTGSHFLDIVDIKLQTDERPEDLYQRLVAFIEDNLLTTGCGIQHHGIQPAVDEDLSPTMENMIVVLWLQLIHPGLPQLVKQKYGSELRNKTLASLKPEISQALSSLLDELRSIEDTKAFRAYSHYPSSKQGHSSRNQTSKKGHSGVNKFCVLCKTAGRPAFNTHYLRSCRYLPDYDKQMISGSSRCIGEEDEYKLDLQQDDQLEDDHSLLFDEPSVKRVSVEPSPYLNVYYENHPVRLTLDTGATTNMVRASFAKAINLPISGATQRARQADGVTPLEVIGEVHCTVTRDDDSFQLDALVVKQLDVDILAGIPFHKVNDIATRPAKNQIVVQGSRAIYYGKQDVGPATARLTQAFLIRAPSQTTILPNQFIDVDVPKDTLPDLEWALEPRLDSPCNQHVAHEKAWPQCQVVTSVGNKIRITNTTTGEITLKNHEHFCQVRRIANSCDANTEHDKVTTHIKKSELPSHEAISLDPNGILKPEVKRQFSELHEEFEQVFHSSVSKYNGASGKIQAVVNIGPALPPQRKGRLPHYNRETLNELQQKFDELEKEGVFAKPEQVNVTVEYLNMSFLVRKPSGGSRLVTSFGEVGQYCKPQPALMPNVDNVIRDIGKWRFIIKTDPLKSFYQIPLSHSSMKYCGVVTPFKGIRVYTRCAMGMPGSESHLEELMSRVLGHLVQEGRVVKLADDLFCGGNTAEEALNNWRLVLTALHRNNLRLSASKTVICPISTTILGWIWRNGSLTASPHKLAALSTVQAPASVQGLRSFVGAFKALSRVMHGYAALMSPLDIVTAGRPSNEKIVWSDDLISTFHKAQEALTSCKAIVIPRRTDHLCIVTDASIKAQGIASTLYVIREGKTHLAGFYNSKLKKHQMHWLPCELEALAIGASVKHFAPYITAAASQAQVLTDSRPCVQAYNKLLRGCFSASARVTTFLSMVSRYQVNISHIAGATNIPSDYMSRHPSECTDQSCQVCKFVEEAADSVVSSIEVKDVIEQGVKMPFTSRAAWQASQHECPDLRRAHSHLSQGTRPSKKITDIPDVKRYLRIATIATDGLLFVCDNRPFQPARDRIVVPRSVVDGLLTALHIRFNHPSCYQLKQIFCRYFYALDIEKIASLTTEACHHCMSLKRIPSQLYPQSTRTVPDVLCSTFAADVMKRYGQLIFVLRETVSSFTKSCIIPSEKHDVLRNAILTLSADIKHLGSDGCVIRVDPAPGFVSLTKDKILTKHGVQLEIGSPKNCNKNPIAEKAIEELGLECLHLNPEGGPLSTVTLNLATANLNSRIRKGGLSAREILTQRDQITGENLPVCDRQLILQQVISRQRNHFPSSKSKAHGSLHYDPCDVSVGDLVYLKADRDKTCARSKYMVTAILDECIQIRKFTQSQFRSKIYEVQPSDCYRVKPTLLGTAPNDHIRGLTERDNITSPTPSPPIQPSTNLNELPHMMSHQQFTKDHNPPTHMDTPEDPPTPLRRSQRSRVTPAWQRHGDWDLSK